MSRCLDLATISYFLVTTFFPGAPWIGWVDLALGLVLLLDFTGRVVSYRRPVRYLESFKAITDIIVILSLLTSVLAQSLAFLRTLRLLRAYQIVDRLARLYPAVGRHQELIGAVLNLAVFVITTSAVVFISQQHINPEISNFLDALYFKVATLSTTGFGDVTLEWPWGRLPSIIMMVAGITSPSRSGVVERLFDQPILADVARPAVTFSADWHGSPARCGTDDEGAPSRLVHIVGDGGEAFDLRDALQLAMPMKR